jgi:hypothetical protein
MPLITTPPKSINDAAIKAHEDRGGVISRSICDFDEYYNERYEGEK